MNSGTSGALVGARGKGGAPAAGKARGRVGEHQGLSTTSSSCSEMVEKHRGGLAMVAGLQWRFCRLRRERKPARELEMVEDAFDSSISR